MSNGMTHSAGSDAAVPAGKIESARMAPVYLPNTDIWESKDRLVLVAEIPGADPESVDISIDRSVLRITARSRMIAPSGYSLIHAEYRDGDYERSFSLPAEINTADIEAKVKDGLLTLVLPKVAPPPVRKITIKTA